MKTTSFANDHVFSERNHAENKRVTPAENNCFNPNPM